MSERRPPEIDGVIWQQMGAWWVPAIPMLAGETLGEFVARRARIAADLHCVKAAWEAEELGEPEPDLRRIRREAMRRN